MADELKQLLYVCLDCHVVAAGHPLKDPRDCCETCGSQNIWEAELLKEVNSE